MGLDTIYARVSAFHCEHGERWAPAPLLQCLARDRSTFREWNRRHA